MHLTGWLLGYSNDIKRDMLSLQAIFPSPTQQVSIVFNIHFHASWGPSFQQSVDGLIGPFCLDLKGLNSGFFQEVQIDLDKDIRPRYQSNPETLCCIEGLEAECRKFAGQMRYWHRRRGVLK